MKLDPGFVNHWKTERLVDQLGAEGVVAVLRLWGNAQIRREFSGLQLTPKRLAMELKWRGDEAMLFAVLTDPDAPWLDPEPDGGFTIHGFAEHQHQVVKLWENGKKGGRPPKPKPKPSSSPSSSSYPICKPNENHMVLSGEPSPKKSKAKGTLEELKAFAVEIGMPADDGEVCFHKWEGSGWKNGGKRIEDWKSTMRSWKGQGYLASQPAKAGGTPPAGTIMAGGRALRV
jgi:hypothetical protein